MNMFIKLIKHFVVIFLILCVSVSCEYFKSANELTELELQAVVLSVDEMVEFNNNVASENVAGKKLRYVHYIGANECSICRMKSMYLWDNFMEENDWTKYVDFFFIVDPGNQAVGDLIDELNRYYFSHSVYFDVNHVFAKDNAHVLSNKLVKSYLIDVKNRIILVGNPQSGEAMNNLFRKVVGNMLAHDGVYVPDEKN